MDLLGGLINFKSFLLNLKLFYLSALTHPGDSTHLHNFENKCVGILWFFRCADRNRMAFSSYSSDLVRVE